MSFTRDQIQNLSDALNENCTNLTTFINLFYSNQPVHENETVMESIRSLVSQKFISCSESNRKELINSLDSILDEFDETSERIEFLRSNLSEVEKRDLAEYLDV